VSAILIEDTTQSGAVSTSSRSFKVIEGHIAVLRSTNLDGSANIAVYYDAPDGSVNNPATMDDGTDLVLTATNPERLINVPGKYRVAVTVAANTPGIVFVNQ
jgi:hypothetical protein